MHVCCLSFQIYINNIRIFVVIAVIIMALTYFNHNPRVSTSFKQSHKVA